VARFTIPLAGRQGNEEAKTSCMRSRPVGDRSCWNVVQPTGVGRDMQSRGSVAARRESAWQPDPRPWPEKVSLPPGAATGYVAAPRTPRTAPPAIHGHQLSRVHPLESRTPPASVATKIRTLASRMYQPSKRTDESFRPLTTAAPPRNRPRSTDLISRGIWPR